MTETEHQEFEELCAMATAGVLKAEDLERLYAHLNACQECSEIFAQYRSIATDGMDFLAGHFAMPKTIAAFDESEALERVMHATDPAKPHVVAMPPREQKGKWWNRPLVRGAIAASILVVVSLASYRFGIELRQKPIAVAGSAPNPALATLEAEKLALQNTIRADTQKINELEQQAAEGNTATAQLRLDAKTAQDNLAQVTADLADQKQQSDTQIAGLIQDRDAAISRLRDSEARFETVQDELNTLRGQHQQDLLRMASLDEQVNTLTASLDDSATRAKTDEQFLTSDKDIRDLIGARNLYIADIMDVDSGGASRKPFGRVFYTKTKSLIFYAYDLDLQPGVRRTSTFQVWGRSNSKDRNPVNLGILYMDSEANRRWTLKVDNPQQLAQLDALFVTIEPKPQVERPTGKPFLVASLRREANHP
jgi:hypothetical protein